MNNPQLSAIASVKKHFIPSLQQIFKESLLSVMLYGSAAGTEYNPGTSDINLMALIEAPAPRNIIELGRQQSRYIRKQRISLQIQTVEEFLNAADVFPMEYLDLIARRQLLFGKDYAETITVDKRHLRHQVEERLRGSINAIRQAILASKGSPRRLKSVLIEWFGAQTALLRGLLRLKEAAHIPFGADALAGDVAEAYGIDGTPFAELSALRDGEHKTATATETAEAILVALTQLSGIVDKLEA
ncbi:hypothetical protein [Sediminispirochaeta bajacaliforniensis]|uniref:hypothetical protein n=1 Tax=Sediminispirochaeta bajacaliforniensis TaxID=148 RepID=UPI0003601000|nr:hypothetical protein [Sediminispirochaeta bajacaliforniensis]